ncbi:MAG: NAD-dependent epimerase/dehydratase family protein [Bdellovibrionales bacterium]
MPGTCAITGVSGFAGNALARRFQAAGWHVIALTRSMNNIPSSIETRPFVLGGLVPPSLLKGADILVHAAYDFSLTRWADICHVNAVGSEYLFDAAARAGVKRQIFISSMSAFEGCRSHYGRSKLAAENAVQIRGGIAVRPGMIYGEKNGGIAAQIIRIAKKWPVIPMIDRGDFPFYSCHVDDLCAAILHLANADEIAGNLYIAANPAPVSLIGLAKSASMGKPKLIFSVPWSWMFAALWLAERIGLRPPFRSDSVFSLVHRNPDPDFRLAVPVNFRPY